MVPNEGIYEQFMNIFAGQYILLYLCERLGARGKGVNPLHSSYYTSHPTFITYNTNITIF